MEDWSTWTSNEDAAGHIVGEHVIYDNGTIVDVDHHGSGSENVPRTETLTAPTGESLILVDNGVTQTVLYNGAAPPLMTLGISDGDTDSALSLLDGKDADKLAKIMADPSLPPWVKAAMIALIIGGMAWDYYNSGSSQPETPTIPANVPPGSKFFFGGVDGTNYYLTLSGQLWEVDAQGFSKQSVVVPGTGMGTDNIGACYWKPVNESNGSDASWKAYQEQITGIPARWSCIATTNDGREIKFDGFDYLGNAYIEAVGPGMAQFYDAGGNPRKWYVDSGGFAEDMQQIQDQVDAAHGRRVVMHVAEKAYAEILTSYIADRPNLNGKVTVMWTPPK